jgi:hypothetical protein
MLPSPSSSPRAILEDRLNVGITPPRRQKSVLLTPPQTVGPSRKRSAKKHAEEKSRKKAKICEPIRENAEGESAEEDPDLFEETDEDESCIAPSKARRRTVSHAQFAFASSLAHTYRRLPGTGS